MSNLAYCYQELGLRAEAEDCYQIILDNGDYNVDMGPQLTAFCKEYGASERVSKLLEKLRLVESERSKRDQATAKGNDIVGEPSSSVTAMLASRPKPAFKPYVTERAKRVREQEQRERDRDSRMYGYYVHLQALTEKSRLGDEAAMSDWMATAKFLIQDFRSNSIFYPTDKYMRFFGYTSEARARSAAAKPSQPSIGTQQCDDHTGDSSGRYFHPIQSTWQD